MPVSPRDIATIIVTYNGEDWIGNCLSSIFQSTCKTDIIVVDNGSSDTSLEILAGFSSQIELIKVDNNLGFGGANNVGIKVAIQKGYNYVFLLNQDTWVESGAIESLVKALDEHPEYGILSPVHMNGEGSGFDKNFKKFVNRYKQVKTPFHEGNLADHTSPIAVSFVNAAAWMVSSVCVEKVGLFNPLFYHYAEDNNYCHRAIHKGWKIGVIKEATIYHDRAYRKANYSPTLDFDRETTLSLSNPNHKRTSARQFLVAVAKMIEISTKIRFYKIPGFMSWAFRRFFVLKAKVESFDEDALHDFDNR